MHDPENGKVHNESDQVKMVLPSHIPNEMKKAHPNAERSVTGLAIPPHVVKSNKAKKAKQEPQHKKECEITTSILYS